MYQAVPRSQADLKYHNLKLIFDLVKREGPVSRAALAKRTGLSATSMTRIVNELLKIGVIAEHSIASVGTSGRPSTLLEIRSGAAYCLCMDAMPNMSKVTLVDLAARNVAYRELYMAEGAPFCQTAEELRKMLPELCRDAGVSPECVACCGISISGHVLETGRISASSQLQWAEVDGVGILESTLDMPAFVENDCKAALLGEQHLLSCAGESTENIAYLKLGRAGVGSAAIVDGRLLRGSRNAAGEIGHFNAGLEGMCAEKCEYRGSFERTISESAVIERAKEIDPAYGSLASINEGLKAGDARLQAMLQEVGEYIAIAISDISCAYNPDTIVLGGNLIASCTGCYHTVMQFVKKRLTRSVQPNLAVRLTKMGSNASLYGMSCIAVEQAIQRLLQKSDTGI